MLAKSTFIYQWDRLEDLHINSQPSSHLSFDERPAIHSREKTASSINGASQTRWLHVEEWNLILFSHSVKTSYGLKEFSFVDYDSEEILIQWHAQSRRPQKTTEEKTHIFLNLIMVTQLFLKRSLSNSITVWPGNLILEWNITFRTVNFGDTRWVRGNTGAHSLSFEGPESIKTHWYGNLNLILIMFCF